MAKLAFMLRLPPRLGVLVLTTALCSLDVVAVHAQQVDPLDPYGLNPKPPPKPAPAPAPAPGTAQPKRDPPRERDADKPALPTDPRERERLLAQEEARKRQAEEKELREIGRGVPNAHVGEPIPPIPGFDIASVIEDPAVFEGQRLRLFGPVRRSCKSGCWVEIAATPDGTAVRVVPDKKWSFNTSLGETAPRYVNAYGLLKKRKIEAAEVKKLDEEAGQKARSPARTEWVLEAEGAEMSWPD